MKNKVSTGKLPYEGSGVPPSEPELFQLESYPLIDTGMLIALW